MANEPTSSPTSTPARSPFDDQPASNLPMGIIAGVVAASVGAGVWAGITLMTGYQLGLVAIAIGFLVGIAVRRFGKGTTMVYSVVGAVLAGAGCAAGNVLSAVGFTANEASVPFMNILSALTMTDVRQVLVEGFEPMDAVFYAIAIYEGFKLSVVKPAPAPVPAQ